MANKPALISGFSIAVVVVIGILLTVTLVPLSLGYLDFYEVNNSS